MYEQCNGVYKQDKMIRKFARLIKLSKTRLVVRGFSADKQMDESGLNELEDYRLGMVQFHNNNYGESLERLSRVKVILEQSNQTETQAYFSLLNTLTTVSFNNRKFKQTGEYLETALDLLRRNDNETIVLFEHYSQMIKFYLHTNLETCLLFTKALLEENNDEIIPFNFQNEYRYYLGVR